MSKNDLYQKMSHTEFLEWEKAWEAAHTEEPYPDVVPSFGGLNHFIPVERCEHGNIDQHPLGLETKMDPITQRRVRTNTIRWCEGADV